MYWCDLLSYSFSVILDFFNTAVWELIKNGMCSNIINLFYKHNAISFLTCWYAKFHFFITFLLRLFSHDLSMMSFLWCWYCNSEVFVAFLIQYFPSHILIRNTHAATHVHGLCTDTDTNIICIYASEKNERERERAKN